MVTLKRDHVEILDSFLEAFDLVGSGWPAISKMLEEEFGFDDPEARLEEAREALRKS